MTQPLQKALALCNTIKRNGYDAYIINASLQARALRNAETIEVDIATDLDIDELIKLFPNAKTSREEHVIGTCAEGGVFYRFYPANIAEGAHPEAAVIRITDHLLRLAGEQGGAASSMASTFQPRCEDPYAGFNDLGEGQVAFIGLPDNTIKRNLLLGVRAMRFAANWHLPIEPNTWMAILRNARRILDYTPICEIMDEWRKVEAENMSYFVRMLFDSYLLHGLMPEVVALSRVRQPRLEAGAEENLFDHTLETMRRYPEELPFDWYGTLACLFHDVGKLFTAEFFDGRWHFIQHSQVGARITRKILHRLRFDNEDVDLICHLVQHHMRFNVMLTDRGVRRFKALDEYPRLIEMTRANIKARGGSYAAFNHNMKILDRADTPEEMLEPLLNGNEIMEFAGLKPGPLVGVIRNALLQAQIRGDVVSVPDAVEFVCRYKDREKLL